MAEIMKFDNRILFWDVSFFRGVHARELEGIGQFHEYRIWCVGERVW